MIPLLFVGDGPRDESTVPLIVGNLLGVAVRPKFSPWARLHGGRGYEAKLRFALRVARDSGARGLVATVDADRSGMDRLSALRAGRETDRAKHPRLPAALGCAHPHHEAWLLDDELAIREALAVPSSETIPSVHRSKSPKNDLDALMELWKPGVPRRNLLGEVATKVNLKRCSHSRETGFADFVDDIRQEFLPLSGQAI